MNTIPETSNNATDKTTDKASVERANKPRLKTSTKPSGRLGGEMPCTAFVW